MDKRPFPGPWALEGACNYVGSEMFYPDSYDSEEARAAKRICTRSCPVAKQCLFHALKHNERHGIWGGTTPKGRTYLLQKIARRGEVA